MLFRILGVAYRAVRSSLGLVHLAFGLHLFVAQCTLTQGLRAVLHRRLDPETLSASRRAVVLEPSASGVVLDVLTRPQRREDFYTASYGSPSIAASRGFRNGVARAGGVSRSPPIVSSPDMNVCSVSRNHGASTRLNSTRAPLRLIHDL